MSRALRLTSTLRRTSPCATALVAAAATPAAAPALVPRQQWLSPSPHPAQRGGAAVVAAEAGAAAATTSLADPPPRALSRGRGGAGRNGLHAALHCGVHGQGGADISSSNGSSRGGASAAAAAAAADNDDDDDDADSINNEDDWRAALRRRGTWDDPVPIASAVGATERVVACSGSMAGPCGHHPTLYMLIKTGEPRQCQHPGCTQVFMLSNEHSPFC